MAEYADHDFTQFARDFFLYSTYFPFYTNERDPLDDPSNFIQRTKSAVFEMSSVFNSFMKRCIFGRHKDVVLKTDEDFLRFLVPKCLRIHTSRSWETLTVVMSLIHEFLLYLQMNRVCYRFHFTAYKCLVAVFRRVHGEQWGAEEWKDLHTHVKNNLTKMRPYLSSQEIVEEENQRKQGFQTVMVNLFQKMQGEDDEDVVLDAFELSLVAEDDPLSLVNDPDEVDNEPFVINLTPDPDVMEEKTKVYEVSDSAIPISRLFPVPKHTKPAVYSSDGSFECSETDSSKSDENDPSGEGPSPRNCESGDILARDNESEGRLDEESESEDRSARNSKRQCRSSRNSESGDRLARNSKRQCRSSRNSESGDILARDSESGDRSARNSESGDRSARNSESGDRSAQNSESDDRSPRDSESGDSDPPNSDLSNLNCDLDREMANGSFRDTFDEEYENAFEMRTGFSKFELYTSKMMEEGASRYGFRTFRDKLLQRSCDYCGIKCYQFSYNLYKRQVDSAI